jgi:hypothetical protein
MEEVGFEVILMRFFATVECLVIWMIILLDWVSKECVLRDFLNNWIIFLSKLKKKHLLQ